MSTSFLIQIRLFWHNYVSFHMRTSPFTEIRVLSQKYVFFHRNTSLFTEIRHFWLKSVPFDKIRLFWHKSVSYDINTSLLTQIRFFSHKYVSFHFNTSLFTQICLFLHTQHPDATAHPRSFIYLKKRHLCMNYKKHTQLPHVAAHRRQRTRQSASRSARSPQSRWAGPWQQWGLHMGWTHKHRKIWIYIYTYIYTCIIHVYIYTTGWRRLIGSPKLQIIFHKRATKYRSLLRKMTYKEKGSYESSPPCM